VADPKDQIIHAMAPDRPGPEKVAIVLLSLGNALGADLLQKFDASDVRDIVGSAEALGTLDKDDLELLVDDFAAQFGRALGIGTDFESMRRLAEQAFSPEKITSLLEPPASPAHVPVWRRFDETNEDALLSYLLDQHPQTVTVILSKLETGFAARCLSRLPGDFRLTVAHRLLKLRPADHRALAAVESCLERDLLAKASASTDAEGRVRLAGLLNRLDRSLAADILESVAASSPREAGELRRMIFSFEDLPALSQASRLALFDKLHTEQIISALRGADPTLREAALSALGARARRMVESELGSDSLKPTKETERVRMEIAALALEMATRGEIELPAGDTPS
jgi:flagellar motor switch protein FliG